MDLPVDVLEELKKSWKWRNSSWKVLDVSPILDRRT